MAKSINVDMIKGADSAAKYPSEHQIPVKKTPVAEEYTIFKTVPGAVLRGRRLKVKASTTTLWASNPRNFSPNKDISDLRPLIKESGGNTQAVDARLVEGKIEIIAGSRRRQVCIEEGLDLTIDLYEEVSNEQAHYIAYTENVRKDVDLLSQACYLRSRFNELKANDNTMTVEIFSNMHNMKPRNMHYYLAASNLPDSILSSANQRDQWSLRMANKLKYYFDALTKSGMKEDDVVKQAKLPLSTPSLVLNALKKLTLQFENSGEPKHEEKYTLKTDKSGVCKIVTPKLSEEQVKKLKAFLEAL
tara:strand:- start:2611 stop:3519 length:909 start_codon:yes stop_codon:yes gene_type:complete